MFNFLQRQTPAPLVFFHIPKTAGTTFRNIIVDVYPARAIYKLSGLNIEKDIKLLEQMPVHKRRKIQVLMGHRSDLAASLLRQPVIFLTFIREPIQHTISSYSYIATSPQNRYYDEVRQLPDIHSFLNWQVQSGFDNQQCRYLAGIDVRSDTNNKAINMATEGQLYFEKALEKLNSFDYVLLTEHFDEAILILKQQLHWKNPPYYQKLNQSKQLAGINNDKKIIEDIGRVNQWDFKLYEHAEKIFERLKKNYTGSLRQDLHQFQEKNTKKDYR